MHPSLAHAAAAVHASYCCRLEPELGCGETAPTTQDLASAASVLDLLEEEPPIGTTLLYSFTAEYVVGADGVPIIGFAEAGGAHLTTKLGILALANDYFLNAEEEE